MGHALLRAIDREELVEDPLYSDPAKAAELGDEVNAMIEGWTMRHTKHEAMEILGRAGVPASACFNAEDIYNDPHLREREMIVTIDHPDRGEFMLPGCPVKLSDSPVSVTPAPILGQHTAEVFNELLGYEEEQLAKLKDESVIA